MVNKTVTMMFNRLRKICGAMRGYAGIIQNSNDE